MSSPVDYSTDTKEEHSHSSINTVKNPETYMSMSDSREQSVNMNEDSSSQMKTFGTPIQKFSKDLIKSLNNFKFSEELTDDNYISWSQAVSELLQSIDLDMFIMKENFSDKFLSEPENLKTRFIITTFILNYLDSTKNLQARNHLSDPNNPHVIVYDPLKTWSFLKNRHARITEVKLTVVTKALYGCTIGRTDSLSSYLDRFKNLVREFYLYKGQMSDHQTARMLVDSISTLSLRPRENSSMLKWSCS